MSEPFKIYDVVETWNGDAVQVVEATVVAATPKTWRIEQSLGGAGRGGFGYRSRVEPGSYERTEAAALAKYSAARHEKAESLRDEAVAEEALAAIADAMLKAIAK